MKRYIAAVFAALTTVILLAPTAQAHNYPTNQLFNLDSGNSVQNAYFDSTNHIDPQPQTGTVGPGGYTAPWLDVRHFYAKNCYVYQVTEKGHTSNGTVFGTHTETVIGPRNYYPWFEGGQASHIAISDIHRSVAPSCN